jgi:DNA-binding NarL/FixJ family response regulator
VRSPRVAVADDTPLFRDGLVALLSAAGATVPVRAADGAELLAALDPAGPAAAVDVAILDIRMPPTWTDEGIATAAELRRRHPGMGVLLLSAHAEVSYAVELMATVATGTGGVGYLLKDNVLNVDVLMRDLRRVIAGELVVDETLVSRLLTRGERRPAVDALGDRELEVLRLMAEGRSNAGIARELYLSPRTVEARVTRVFNQLGLDTTADDNNRVRAVIAFLRAADEAG